MPRNPDIGYSFCESVVAYTTSTWHIRKLSDAGPKYGGGADTAALCDRTVAWDLDVEMTAAQLEYCCRECVREFQKIARVYLMTNAGERDSTAREQGE